MKSVLGVLLLVVVAAYANDTLEAFLRGQDELSLVHEFAETAMAENRQFLSVNLEILGRMLIDSHLDAYSVIQTLALETDDELRAIVTNDNNQACVDRILDR